MQTFHNETRFVGEDKKHKHKLQKQINQTLYLANRENHMINSLYSMWEWEEFICFFSIFYFLP